MEKCNCEKCTCNVLDLVGETPLIEIPSENGGKIFAKLETTNLTGSIKDRMACYIIKKAEEKGQLKRGSKILEVTSGNTGIAFAMISAIRGYKFTAVLPESASVERIKMMKFFGAEVVLTPAGEDMAGAVNKYNELARQDKDAWLPRQFENEDNVAAHREGTGRELIKQAGEKIDAFVAGTGTGGTLIGVAEALKEQNPDVKIFAVEPLESAVLSGENPGHHKIQGIGEGFIPQILQNHMKLVDGVIKIKSDDAISMSKKLAQERGLLVGISSGANVLAAIDLSKKFKNVATVLPDRGERYLSCM